MLSSFTICDHWRNGFIHCTNIPDNLAMLLTGELGYKMFLTISPPMFSHWDHISSVTFILVNTERLYHNQVYTFGVTSGQNEPGDIGL